MEPARFWQILLLTTVISGCNLFSTGSSMVVDSGSTSDVHVDIGSSAPDVAMPPGLDSGNEVAPDMKSEFVLPDLSGVEPLTQRSIEGIVALWDFSEDPAETEIVDHSGVEPALPLRATGDVVGILGRNGVTLTESGYLEPVSPPTKFYERIGASQQFTVEAWVRPDNLTQDGPARIVTLSIDTSYRNFTLGQAESQAVMRLRTTDLSKYGTRENGLGARHADGVSLNVTHIVATYDGTYLDLYINGVRGSRQTLPGGLANWDQSHLLRLGDDFEEGNSRQWEGDLYLVAVYDRALSGREVAGHFAIGSGPLGANQ